MGLALLPGARLAGSLVLLHRGKITRITQRRGVVLAWEMGESLPLGAVTRVSVWAAAIGDLLTVKMGNVGVKNSW